MTHICALRMANGVDRYVSCGKDGMVKLWNAKVGGGWWVGRRTRGWVAWEWGIMVRAGDGAEGGPMLGGGR